MLPIVIPEEIVNLFKYWQEGIKVGMTYQNELYFQFKTYNSDRRLEAYDEGYQLSEDGKQVCITVNTDGYTLWQNLRSLSSRTKVSEKIQHDSDEESMPFQWLIKRKTDIGYPKAFA